MGLGQPDGYQPNAHQAIYAKKQMYNVYLHGVISNILINLLSVYISNMPVTLFRQNHIISQLLPVE